MGGKDRRFYVRLVLGVACVALGIAAGQTVDQRLTLLAMFPAVALLSGVIAELTAPRKPKAAPPPQLSSAERELLGAVWNSGDGLSPAGAAETTSLSEDEAADALSGLAEKGYLRRQEAGGTALYGRAGTGGRG